MPIYSDINQYNPTQKGRVTDVESVYQAIHNILATKKGERIFNPEFGTDLDESLFELMDEITAEEVFMALVSAIERWEDRLSLIYAKSSVTPDYENQTFDVSLVFKIHGYEEEEFNYEGTVSR